MDQPHPPTHARRRRRLPPKLGAAAAAALLAASSTVADASLLRGHTGNSANNNNGANNSPSNHRRLDHADGHGYDDLASQWGTGRVKITAVWDNTDETPLAPDRTHVLGQPPPDLPVEVISDPIRETRPVAASDPPPPDLPPGLVSDPLPAPPIKVISDPVEEFATLHTEPAKEAKWWPAEISGVKQCVSSDEYPDAYVGSGALLSDTQFECCAAYLAPLGMACTLTGGEAGDSQGEAAAEPTVPATTVSPKEEYWYPHIDVGAGTPTACVKDANYDDKYLESPYSSSFLFSSEEACCASHPAACPKPARWYMAIVGEEATCVEGSAYPDEYGEVEGLLFESEGGCCAAFGICAGPGSDAKADEAEAATTTVATTATTTSITTTATLAPHLKPVHWWPVTPTTDGARLHCEHSNAYPDAYLQAHEATATLFATHHACCTAYHACPVKWYPLLVAGRKTCIEGSEYTHEFTTKDTREECCDMYGCEDLEVPATVAPEQDPRPKYWWPVEPTHGGRLHCEYSANYPESYEGSTKLFDAEHACCSSYDACPPHWYPSAEGDAPTCTYGSDYPAEYTLAEFRASFFHDTKFECCQAFPSACVGMGFYPLEDGSGCVWGGDYPEYYKGGGYVFGTEGECCEVWCGKEVVPPGEAEVTTATVAVTTTTRDPCTDCVWHESIKAFHTCSNSDDYPAQWDTDPNARSYFFFRSVEECCGARFPEDCQIEDVGDASEDGDFVPLGAVTEDDFEGNVPVLPFDFGQPIQWRYEALAGGHALTNVPVEGLGATADLTLKFSVDAPATVTCRARVDVAMPYEYFALVVNGEMRNRYNQPLGEWIAVTTGMAPGRNELVFRVQNAEFDHRMGERLPEMNLGSGRVWLDDCKVNTH